MAKKHYSRKELRLKEDPFIAFANETYEKLKKNYEKVITVIVVVLFVLGASYAYHNFSQTSSAEASQRYYAAMNTLNKAVSPQQNQDQKEELPGAEERVNLLKQADSQFNELLTKDSSSDFYESGIYHRGLTQYYLKEMKEALRLFDQYLYEYPAGKYAPAAKLIEVYINEQDNKRVPALEMIEEFFRFYPDSPLRFQVLMDKGRISNLEAEAQEKASNAEAAKKYYSQARDAYQEIVLQGEDNPYYSLAKKAVTELSEIVGPPTAPKSPDSKPKA